MTAVRPVTPRPARRGPAVSRDPLLQHWRPVLLLLTVMGAAAGGVWGFSRWRERSETWEAREALIGNSRQRLEPVWFQETRPRPLLDSQNSALQLREALGRLDWTQEEFFLFDRYVGRSWIGYGRLTADYVDPAQVRLDSLPPNVDLEHLVRKVEQNREAIAGVRRAVQLPAGQWAVDYDSPTPIEAPESEVSAAQQASCLFSASVVAAVVREDAEAAVTAVEDCFRLARTLANPEAAIKQRPAPPPNSGALPNELGDDERQEPEPAPTTQYDVALRGQEGRGQEGRGQGAEGALGTFSVENGASSDLAADAHELAPDDFDSQGERPLVDAPDTAPLDDPLDANPSASSDDDSVESDNPPLMRPNAAFAQPNLSRHRLRAGLTMRAVRAAATVIGLLELNDRQRERIDRELVLAQDGWDLRRVLLNDRALHMTMLEESPLMGRRYPEGEEPTTGLDLIGWREQMALLDFGSRYAEIADSPYHEIPRRHREIFVWRERTWPEAVVLRWIAATWDHGLRLRWRILQTLRAARLGLRVDAYVRRHGRLPPWPRVVVEPELLGELVDVETGEALLPQPTDEGFVVESLRKTYWELQDDTAPAVELPADSPGHARFEVRYQVAGFGRQMLRSSVETPAASPSTTQTYPRQNSVP